MKILYIALLVLLIACSNDKKQSNQNTIEPGLSEPWVYKDSLLKSIEAPTFNSTVYNIVDYGAVEGGTKLCTEAIAEAILVCNEKGGGIVEVPEGKWLTGPVVLKSNVNLHLTKGSTLLFATQKDLYLPVVHTRFEGMECMNYSPLVYAYKAKNIAITGEGTLDGQGHVWWHWKGKWEGSVEHDANNNADENQLDDVNLLTQMVEDNVPLEKRIFGEGHYLRSSFIQPYLCENVLIEGVKVIESPMWIIHPVLCSNVTVRDVKIESLGPNNDGCDPECCDNVLIDSCYFDTGDDCIAIKSGRNNDGRRIGIPSKNIIVQNCNMVEGHGGVVMGSEISGNVSYVFAENCTMDSPNLERAIRIKSNTMRGGVIEHIYVRNIEVKQVREAILKINMHYAIYSQSSGNNIPVVRNVYLENVNSQKSKYGYWIKGIESMPVSNISFTDCEFNNAEHDYFEEHVGEINYSNLRINGNQIQR